MKATLILRDRQYKGEAMFSEMLIWQVPKPVPGSEHRFKYSLAFVVNGDCVLRYDNEAGKGDHKHIGDHEYPYIFRSIRQLLLDFEADTKGWINDNA